MDGPNRSEFGALGAHQRRASGKSPSEECTRSPPRRLYGRPRRWCLSGYDESSGYAAPSTERWRQKKASRNHAGHFERATRPRRDMCSDLRRTGLFRPIVHLCGVSVIIMEYSCRNGLMERTSGWRLTGSWSSRQCREFPWPHCDRRGEDGQRIDGALPSDAGGSSSSLPHFYPERSKAAGGFCVSWRGLDGVTTWWSLVS